MISIALLASLISSYAYAVTYTYTGANYTDANGAYTTAMRMTGIFTTSSPIPPNFAGDISGIITSWSFSDGVQTINNTNGLFHPNFPPAATTDASGNLTSAKLLIHRVPISTTIGGTEDFIWTSGPINIAVVDAVCQSVNDGYCDNWNESSDWASSDVPGIWETYIPPTTLTTPIPTMAQWALMLMALLLGLIGITRIRRQV